MSDSTFEIHEFTIPVSKAGDKIIVIPFGDIHRDARNCDVKRWHNFLNWAKTKERIYFLGMGDYADLLSFSERKSIRSANLHDSSIDSLDDLYIEKAELLIKELSFMKGKLVGLLEGNHYGVLMSGMTTTQYMAHKLETKYLGVNALIRLNIQFPNRSYEQVIIYAHHGRGSGRSSGSSINSVQDLARNASAHIYICGHDHKKWALQDSKLYLEGAPNKGLRLRSRTITYLRSGSFLQGYVPGRDSYVTRAALKPSDLGVVKLSLTPKYKKYGASYVDVHASI